MYILFMIQRIYLKMWFFIMWGNRFKFYINVCVKWKKYQIFFRGEFNYGMENVYNKGQFFLLFIVGKRFQDFVLCLRAIIYLLLFIVVNC